MKFSFKQVQWEIEYVVKENIKIHLYLFENVLILFWKWKLMSVPQKCKEYNMLTDIHLAHLAAWDQTYN